MPRSRAPPPARPARRRPETLQPIGARLGLLRAKIIIPSSRPKSADDVVGPPEVVSHVQPPAASPGPVPAVPVAPLPATPLTVVEPPVPVALAPPVPCPFIPPVPA